MMSLVEVFVGLSWLERAHTTDTSSSELHKSDMATFYLLWCSQIGNNHVCTHEYSYAPLPTATSAEPRLVVEPCTPSPKRIRKTVPPTRISRAAPTGYLPPLRS